MSALEVIRRVEVLGGHLVIEEGHLKVRASAPLPDEILAAVRNEKASIMVALGEPLDTVLSGVLDDIRPHLPETLRNLADDRLLVLVNWTILNALNASVRKVASR
jgi:hypothetical protein